MVLNNTHFSQQTQKHSPSPRNLQSFATPQASGGGGRAPRACRQGIAFVPCPSLVVPFSRAPGERHGAPEPRPRDPRGNSWHHRQHRESARGRIRPAGHDGPIMADPSGASHPHAQGLRSPGCSCVAPSCSHGFLRSPSPTCSAPCAGVP